jgi:hypothetical protein
MTKESEPFTFVNLARIRGASIYCCMPKLYKLRLTVATGLLFLVAGCAAPPESMSSLAERKYREMTQCVDQRTDEAIERGNFNKFSYGPILQACASQYGSLRVARNGARLPDIPYEYWQLKIFRSYGAYLKRTQSQATSVKATGEDCFLESYYSLQGQLVLANTALMQCPADYQKPGEMLVLVKTLLSTKELLEVSDRFIALRDQEMPSNLRGLVQDFKLKAYSAFVEAADSAFEKQKQPSTCPKVLDLRLTESALNDYLQKLSLLDADGLSKELKDALQDIKFKANDILKAVRNV